MTNTNTRNALYRGDSLQAAADEVINKLIPAAGGDGGVGGERSGHGVSPGRVGRGLGM